MPRCYSLLQGHHCHSNLAPSFGDGTKTKTGSGVNGQRGDACVLLETSQDGNSGAYTHLTFRPTLGVPAGLGSTPRKRSPLRAEGRVGEPGRPSQTAGHNREGDGNSQPTASDRTFMANVYIRPC